MSFEFKRVKIFVTIPKENFNDVRNAVCDAGAGVIGNYTCCTFSVSGNGTFVPNENANPYIGTNNNLEVVERFVPISARLIANKSGFKFNTARIEQLRKCLCELVEDV